MEPEVQVVVTGGALDALSYDFPAGKILAFGRPVVKSIFEEMNIRADIVTLMQKDSSDMGNNDRAKILMQCRTSNAERILITHGTDTMLDTGLLLDRYIKTKVIVLTGSLPYMSKTKTFAASNVNFALAACQTLPHGVYIAMNGRIVPVEYAEKVQKHDMTYFISKKKSPQE